MKKMRHTDFQMNSKGFTLLELALGLVILSIILITSNTMMANLVNAQKFEKTVDEIQKLNRALVGDADVMQTGHQAGFGYFEIHRGWPVGAPGSCLAALYEVMHEPMSVRDVGGGVRLWHDLFQDEWGRTYQGSMVFTPQNFTIRSWGEDRTNNNGGGDDIDFRVQNTRYFANSIRFFVTDAIGSQLRGSHNINVGGSSHQIYWVHIEAFGRTPGGLVSRSEKVSANAPTSLGDLPELDYTDGYFESRTATVLAGFYQISVTPTSAQGGAAGDHQNQDNLAGRSALNQEFTIRKLITVYPRGANVSQFFNVRFPGVLEGAEVGAPS